ncbi:MAG: ABC transporter ATP-binding protein, partial [Nitratireductor sp.]
MSAPLISVRDLSVAFSQDEKQSLAVDRVSFDIGRGETVALVGESGSGKSVTALSVLKLLPYPAASHPSGEILFDGQDLLGAKEQALRRIRGRDITMIFQEPMTSLNPVLSIGHQLTEAIRVHRPMPRSEARALAVKALSAVRIGQPERRLQQYPHELSGGMRQRVMIAMAIAGRPRVL